MSRAKPTDLDSALATMSAEALREALHEVLLELDERAHARVVGSLVAAFRRSKPSCAEALTSSRRARAHRVGFTAASRTTESR